MKGGLFMDNTYQVINHYHPNSLTIEEVLMKYFTNKIRMNFINE